MSAADNTKVVQFTIGALSPGSSRSRCTKPHSFLTYCTSVFDPSSLTMFPWSLLCQAARIFVLLAWLDVPMDVRATEINTTTIDDADSHIQYSKNWNVSGDCDE